MESLPIKEETVGEVTRLYVAVLKNPMKRIGF
jgi:hypothetical protein